MTSGKALSKGRPLAVLTALVLAFAPALAEARAGKGSSSGSRGSRTESVSPRTNTAPAPAQSFQRSNPTQSAPTRPTASQTMPAPRPAAQPQASFGSRLMSGAVGFVTGAAIANVLRNTGFFDGMGALAGVLGMIITFLLIGVLGAMIVALLRPESETQPQLQGRLQGVTGDGDPGTPVPAPLPRHVAPRSTFGRRGAGATR
jgi:predicted lipid-binding transport protein (Tim44 family)